MDNDNRKDNDITLVLGGTGKTGRRVAQRLAARGRPVRIGSRGGAPPFAWERPDTWDALLDRVGSVYLAYYPDLTFPGAADAIGAFSARAVARGARRLVLLSGRGEEGSEPSERAVQEAGVDWTVLRAAWFDQNFSEHFLLEPVRRGVIALPAGAMVEPFLDADDIAAVAVCALLEPGHAGAVYELTGPRLLSFADAAAEIATVTGRDVQYVPVEAEEYVAAATADGVPEEEVVPLTELFTRVLDGRNAQVTEDVGHVLGRPARDFRDYARQAAATGVWDVRSDAGLSR